MSKKKILSLCLVIALAAVAVLGGTLAYFTDTDSAKNVMVTGNVDIIQEEWERTEDGELKEFEQNKPLMPVTYDTFSGYNSEITDQSGVTFQAFANENNIIDKIVDVTNEGSEDAYIRTLIAFEVPTTLPEGASFDYDVPKMEDGAWYDVVNTLMMTVTRVGLNNKALLYPTDDAGNYCIITVGGVTYLVTEYYYNTNGDSSLKPDETSHASLAQIYLRKEATNNDANLLVGVDGAYNILVLTQATQTEGFADAKTALDTAFGVTNEANATEWFAAIA